MTSIGPVINQTKINPEWYDKCMRVVQSHCPHPGPGELKEIEMTVSNGAIGDGGEVFTKRNFGFVGDIRIRVDMKSFCGPGTVFESRRKQCVPTTVPESMCGESTAWDAEKMQCVRTYACADGFSFRGDVCGPTER